MAIPAKEIGNFHSFLTGQLQRQHFDKSVGRSNLEIRLLIGYDATRFQIMCYENFLRFKYLQRQRSGIALMQFRPCRRIWRKTTYKIIYFFTPPASLYDKFP